MRRTILSISLIVAVFAFVLQLPIQDIKDNVAAATGLQSQAEYGENLGIIVDQVVNNIHAKIPRALITHADVLAIMCMESANLVGKRDVITSSAGARGLTQVMPGTLKDYATKRLGGFYLNNRPDLLYADSRFSVEAGALIYNHHLMNYIPKYGPVGGRTQAAIAYNGGPGRVGKVNIPSETRTYAYSKLPKCFNALRAGQSPVKSTVWSAMVAKVKELTGGKMSLDGAPGVPSDIPSQGWPVQQEPANSVKSIGQKWWDSLTGKSVANSQQQSAQKTSAPTSQTAQQSTQAQQGSSWLDELLGKNTATNPLAAAQPKAELTCDEVGGKVQLRWSCPTGTTVSRGFGTLDATFDTHGAGAGIVTTQPVFGAEYILQCLKGHQLHAETKCVVPVFETVETVDSLNSSGTGRVQDSIPSGVTMEIEHQDDVILWKTTGTTSCRLSSGDRSATGVTGGVRIGTLTEDMLVKLECESASGPAVKYKNIEI